MLQVVSRLESDLAEARADLKLKESEMQSVRGELQRIRGALTDPDTPLATGLAIAAGGGEAALVQGVRGEARRLADELRRVQAELVQVV